MNEQYQLDSRYQEALPYRGNAARALATSSAMRWIAFWLFHMPLGLGIAGVPLVGTVWAYTVLLYALFSLLKPKPTQMLLVVTYIASIEVLWRGRAAVNFEFSKYTICGLLLIGLVRYNRIRLMDKRPILYFALLLPSIFVMPILDREAIAFNLAGPFTLAVAIMYFSTERIRASDFRNMLYVFFAPVIGQATVAIYATLTTQNLEFYQASNPVTAGGGGPNQVSALFGLAAVLAYLAAIIYHDSPPLRAAVFGFVIWFLGQAALTFSRGGLFAGVGAIGVATTLLLTDRRTRSVLLAVLAGAGVLVYFVIFPQLDAFTSGQLSLRLQDPDTTGRDDVMMVDIELFFENPLMGVGPGESNYAHAEVFRLTRAHTEYSRALAEHGLFGLASLLVLSLIFGSYLLKSTPAVPRAVRFTMLAWAIVTMWHVATRTATLGWAVGIGVTTLLLTEDEDEELDEELDEPVRF